MAGGFEELDVYKEARTLRKRVYRLAAQLPSEERFSLAQQMRRAAVSVTNNIAEGHGSRSFRHNISYLYRSRGSVCELRDDLNVCEDEGYFLKEHLDDLRRQAETVVKLLNGYINYLRRRLAESGRPAPPTETDQRLSEGQT
ncbi:MAG TPA: four helix bundle protein [Phycisphaerae bacterium]|nr:four helix bundle protein [Phycisphaerae bacterium]HUT58017.1 four helix bundle protein [Phycisphaerae bacterium]